MNDLPQNDLSRAVEELYLVFGAYPAPEPSFCKHCVTKEEDAALRSKPLRELHAADVSRYWWKAISTWGTVDQFKHFLPRLLQILVSEKVRDSPEILLGKLLYGELWGWPEAERHAVTSFCWALWKSALDHHPLYELFPSFPEIDTCLCTIAQVVDDVFPLLNQWDQDSRPAAGLHMIDFAVENVTHIREVGKLSNTFWKTRRMQMVQVQDWFMSHDFCIAFDVATSITTDEEICADIARSIRKRSADH